jgi:transcriptional/translational regulatory protein YebC/TACO1
MGEAGSVGWQFTRKAYFSIPASGVDFDTVFMLAADGGADDVSEEDGSYEIYAPVESFKTIVDQLRAAKLQPEEAELRMVPNQEIELDADGAMQVMRCIETLEEFDDVQNVFTNLHLSDELMSSLESED